MQNSKTQNTTRTISDIGLLWMETCRHLTKKRKSNITTVTLEQMFNIGNRSVIFLLITVGFIGMVMIYQSCFQLQRITGDLSMIGPNFIKIVIFEIGPSITGLMLATRVGAGIAAELAAMKVTEQIDALRMTGVSPVEYLILPRFTASVVMTMMLTILTISIAIVTGGISAYIWFDINPRLFFRLDQVESWDVITAVLKAFCYGQIIPIVSSFFGFRAQNGSAGVGDATTSAVIGSSFGIILCNFFISAIILILRDIIT